MSERGDNLDIFRDFVNGELDKQGAFDNFPKAPQEPTKKKEEPSVPAPDTLSDPNLYRIDVPGADFLLRVHQIGDELPVTLSFTSIEQPFTFRELHKTVGDVMRATYSNSYTYAKFSAVGVREKEQHQFDFSDAWSMEDYKEFLEEGSVDSLIYTATLPIFLGQQVGRSTTFSYRFSRDPHTHHTTEGISISEGLAKNFPESLAGHLLTRNEDYNRMLVKDPDTHATLISNEVQSIAHIRFPNPFSPR